MLLIYMQWEPNILGSRGLRVKAVSKAHSIECQLCEGIRYQLGFSSRKIYPRQSLVHCKDWKSNYIHSVSSLTILWHNSSHKPQNPKMKLSSKRECYNKHLTKTSYTIIKPEQPVGHSWLRWKNITEKHRITIDLYMFSFHKCYRNSW